METTQTTEKKYRGRKPSLEKFVTKYIEKNTERLKLADLDATINGLTILKAQKFSTQTSVPAPTLQTVA